MSSENSFESYYTNLINSKELDFDVESSDKKCTKSVKKHTPTPNTYSNSTPAQSLNQRTHNKQSVSSSSQVFGDSYRVLFDDGYQLPEYRYDSDPVINRSDNVDVRSELESVKNREQPALKDPCT